MKLMLKGAYLHPSGQMPAYEWNFSDVNPPVHAFATLFMHRTEQALRGETDLDFLRATFNKLLLNFTWWVNRKDRFGKNVFEGGFLGLDNIGVFDRSAPLPTGGHLEQADGTAWMALFSQNMTELAIELAAHDPIYEDMVLKFAEHFYYIAAAMNRSGQDGMWDEEDGFYYDLLRLPDGSATRLKVRSMVGLLPLCATTVIEEWQRDRIPRVMAALAGTAAPDARALQLHSPHRPGAFRRGGARDHRPGQPGAAAPDSRQNARRERVPGPPRHPLDLQVPRAAPLCVPRGRSGIPGGLPAGRVEHRHVRRQLQLAGTGLDAGEHDDHSGAPEFLSLLRRQLQNRMSHGLREDDEPLRGEPGDRRPAHQDLHPRPTGPAPRPRRHARSSRPTPTGATTSSSTSTSTATTGPGSGPAIRLAGPAWWPNSSSFTACWIRSGPWKRANRRGSSRAPLAPSRPSIPVNLPRTSNPNHRPRAAGPQVRPQSQTLGTAMPEPTYSSLYSNESHYC